jgi:hypothetical protein
MVFNVLDQLWEDQRCNISMFVLSTKVVQSIMERRSVGTMPIDDEDPNATIEKLSLQLNVSKKEPSDLSRDYFFVSNLINHINLKTKHLYVCPYQLHTSKGPNTSLEVVFFLFFFPQGNSAYDGQTSIYNYLKYRMSYLFFPFIIYKPYLLFMYGIR